MRCHICDKTLSEKEISWNKDIGTFECCSVCLEISLDAAFSDGFSRPDEDDSFVIIEDNTDYESAMNTMYSLLSRKPQEENENDE